MKKFTVNGLSASEFEKLAKELDKYAETISRKCKQLCGELAYIGLKTSETLIAESPLGKYIHVTVEGNEIPNGFKAVLIATGEVKTSDKYPPFSTILAVEFGAGIRYNPVPNRKAGEMGYGVGTFPGQLHAFDKNGWFFWDKEKQRWIHSYGVKATMPMVRADDAMLAKVEEIAKNVFN